MKAEAGIQDMLSPTVESQDMDAKGVSNAVEGLKSRFTEDVIDSDGFPTGETRFNYEAIGEQLDAWYEAGMITYQDAVNMGMQFGQSWSHEKPQFGQGTSPFRE